MDIHKSLYITKDKAPPHELAAVVNLFREFIGEVEFLKIGKGSREAAYGFWLKKCKGCTFGHALEIIKELETLPIQYNKAGTVVNKLKKIHGKSK